MQKRTTKTKLMVMDVLCAADSALSQEEIAIMLPTKMDRVTLYRILQGFHEDGRVHKITDTAGITRYAACKHCTAEQHSDNHAHFQCIACNEVLCMQEPLVEPSLPSGFRAVSKHELITGYCNKCSAAAKILVAAATLCGFHTKLHARVEDTTHVLQEIVVMQSTSHTQQENVMSVTKITTTDASIHGMSFAEKLTSAAGVSVLTTGAGIGKPVIRGMSGNRIAIYTGSTRVENQQWGDEHGLGIAEHGVAHAEVLKGPASLLYGSDALGGAIHFVDEPYIADNNIAATIFSEYSTNNREFKENVSLKMSKNRWHVNAFGGYSSAMDYYGGDGARINNSRFNNLNLRTYAGYTGAAFASTLKYSYLRENYGLTEVEEDEDEEVEMAENGRNANLPCQKLSTHIVSSENTFYTQNGGRVKVDAAYTYNNRQELEESMDAPALNMNLHTITYNARWFSPKVRNKWTIIAGSQGMWQQNLNYGQELLIPDGTTADVGGFAIADYYYTNKAYVQAGLRGDARKIHTAAIEDIDAVDKMYPAMTFSVGVYHPLTEALSLRANIASGFRAPTAFELCSNGIHEGTNRFEHGNPNLLTENSYQADVAANYSTMHLEFYVNPYINYVRNYIFLQPTGAMRDSAAEYDYMQQDARLYGGEAGFHLHPHPLDWLHVEGSYSSTFGEHRCGEYLPLMPAQKLNLIVHANFVFKGSMRKLSVYVRNQYSFAQNRVSVQESSTSDYYLLHAGAAADFVILSKMVQINVSAQNLLGAAYYDHLSRYKNDGILQQGRTWNVQVRVPLTNSSGS